MPCTVRISADNAKGVGMNVSKVPGRDCGPNSKYCFGDGCYALKAFRTYPTVREAWTTNSRAFREDPYAAVESVSDALFAKKTPPRHFRIDVAGDILNQDELEAWKVCAMLHPRTRFLSFTKNDELDFRFLPGNLEIVASLWPGMPDRFPNRRIMRRAYMQDGTETRIPADAIECGGLCSSCGMCWDLRRLQKDVWFEKH